MPEFKLRIKLVVKERIVETSTEQLAVVFDVYTLEEGVENVLRTARHGFPIGTSKEDIIAELTKYIDLTKSEYENASRNKEIDEINKETDATIEALQGTEI